MMTQATFDARGSLEGCMRNMVRQTEGKGVLRSKKSGHNAKFLAGTSLSQSAKKERVAKALTSASKRTGTFETKYAKKRS